MLGERCCVGQSLTTRSPAEESDNASVSLGVAMGGGDVRCQGSLKIQREAADNDRRSPNDGWVRRRDPRDKRNRNLYCLRSLCHVAQRTRSVASGVRTSECQRHARIELLSRPCHPLVSSLEHWHPHG